MIVDVHTHIWDATGQLGPQAAAARRRAARPWEGPLAPADLHHQAMAGVDHAIILGCHIARADLHLPAALVARAVAAHPEKYFGFAGIDPTQDRWLDDLLAAQDLGLVGVVLSPAGQGFRPTDDTPMRLLAECRDCGLAVMVEPGLDWPGAVMSCARPALWDDVARALPDLPLVLAELGRPWVAETLTLVARHPHVYADVSGLAGRPWERYQALVAVWETGAIDRLLFGSGYPDADPREAASALRRTSDLARGTALPVVPQAAIEALLHRDALACLGLRPSAAPPAGAAPEGPDLADLSVPTTPPSTQGPSP